MNKARYAKTQIPLWEQKLIKIEQKQKKLRENMLKEFEYSVKFRTDDLYDKGDMLYVYETCSSQGCYKCDKQIPYFWPALWSVYNDIFNKPVDVSTILQKLGVVNRGYTIEDLKNYLFGCCSMNCRLHVVRKCNECYRVIRPSGYYSVERFCSDECRKEFDYQCYQDNYYYHY